jgi:predicted  nucleic acid-binding Zn-ribbon protein
LRERSLALKQNQNRNDLHSTMLDNSLLDESVMDSIPYSLHYSKECNRTKMSHSSTNSSPLQKLFQRPLQTCRAQFIHEPETMDAKASYGCNLFSNQDNANEDDGNIVGFSSNFSKEELDTVFRRPRSLNTNEETQSSMLDGEIDNTSSNTRRKSNRSSHGLDRDRNFTTPSVYKNSSKFTEPVSASTAQTEVSTPDLKDLNLSMDESKSPKQLFQRETSATDLRLEQALFELDAKNKILKQISDEKDQIERKMHEMERQYRNSQQDKENIEASFLLDSFISEEEAENQMRDLTKLRKINHQVRLEINQEKKKNEELQNQIRALQSESLNHMHHSYALNDSHKQFQQEHDQFGSKDNTKDTLVMKVDIVSLKSKLSNVEHLLKQEKEAREMDRNQFKKDESRLQTQIQKLMKSLAKGKTSAQYSALEAQLQIQKEDNELLQERLAESEVYISTLEKTMDDQLKAWKEEEEDFKKESSTLREKAARTVATEEALYSAKEHIKNLEHDLSASKREIARLSSQEECEINHSKESSKESVEHLLELANSNRK